MPRLKGTGRRKKRVPLGSSQAPTLCSQLWSRLRQRIAVLSPMGSEIRPEPLNLHLPHFRGSRPNTERARSTSQGQDEAFSNGKQRQGPGLAAAFPSSPGTPWARVRSAVASRIPLLPHAYKAVSLECLLSTAALWGNRTPASRLEMKMSKYFVKNNV